MSFMQQQVTRKMRWIEIDGTCGTTAIPAKDAPEITRVVGNDAMLINGASVFYEGTVESVEFRNGYGARLSAPGYGGLHRMVCMFDTAKEAQEYLDEYYPDDDEESGVWHNAATGRAMRPYVRKAHTDETTMTRKNPPSTKHC